MVLCEPVQQLAESAVFVCQDHFKLEIKSTWRGNSHDEHGLLSRLASQALLHPIVFPVEFCGPASCAGHPGFRSTGHEATEQPLPEGMILMGILNPCTTETTYTSSLTQSRRGRWMKRRARTIESVEIPRALESPLRHGCRRHRLHGARRRGREWGCELGYVNVVGKGRTVPVWGSHWSPPLQPPSRQPLVPAFEEKLQFRRP